MIARPAPIVRSLAALVASGLAIATLGIGCGKKGPPLAPVTRVPARIEPFEVRRIGDAVFVQFQVPTANQDGTSPADLARVEVWAFTGSPGPIANVYKYGTLVAAFPVRRPPEPEESPAPSQASDRDAPTATPAPKPPPSSRRPLEPGVEQGAAMTVTEPVTPQFNVLVLTPEQKRQRPRPVVTPYSMPLAPAPAELSMARIYVAVGVNHKGQRGPASARISIPLLEPPPAPPAPTVTYTETAIDVKWDVPDGVRRSVQVVSVVDSKPPAAGQPGAAGPPAESKPQVTNPAADAQAATTAETKVLPSKPVVAQPSGSAFEVVDEAGLQPAVPRPDLRLAGARGVMPAGTVYEGRLLAPVLNEKPLEQPAWTDSRIQFGTERCYVVRTVNAFGPIRIDSRPSPKTCVTPVDTFPPAAPKNLAAMSGGGAVSLIWEANTEADLAGYLVLRGEAPGGTLAPLTPAPIKETTFRDTSAKPGVRYVYVVVAVDTAVPPNASARTSRVEETAK